MVEAYFPSTLIQALQIMSEKDVIPYAGGTDIMVAKKFAHPFLYLEGITELQKIRRDLNQIHIGAACTYEQLLASEDIPRVLKDAILQIASPSIRNLGTIGGNICNASPAGDSLPVLYALNAVLILETLGETREVPIEEYITGVKRTIRKPSWLLKEIVILDWNKPYIWQKVGARKAQAIAKLSFAGLHELEDGKIKDIRIAFGAVGATVARDRGVEEEIIGKKVSDIDISSVIQYYGKIIRPIDDQRSEAAYRRTVCLNILGDYLENIAAEGKE